MNGGGTQGGWRVPPIHHTSQRVLTLSWMSARNLRRRLSKTAEGQLSTGCFCQDSQRENRKPCLDRRSASSLADPAGCCGPAWPLVALGPRAGGWKDQEARPPCCSLRSDHGSWVKGGWADLFPRGWKKSDGKS